MRVVAPAWLCHGRGPNSGIPIFSLDIQHEECGGRIATAGQDCMVRIWDVGVLESRLRKPGEVVDIDEEEDGGVGVGVGGVEGDAVVEGLLGEVRAHAKSVSVVRWGCGGDMRMVLASGGDDCCVVLYEREVRGGGRVFGGSGGRLKEDWRARKSLRGHESDVTDLAWSPSGNMLASASVDNVVCVWEVWRWGGRLVRRLEGHRGMVKGVAWDPMGRFLASQGSDRRVVVWRTGDWQKEVVISEPFDKAVKPKNEKQFFLRLDWSPCGTQLVATNGYNPPKHVAALFSRDEGFIGHVDLAGHTEPVVSTRFSPRFYTRDESYRSRGQGGNGLMHKSMNGNGIGVNNANGIHSASGKVGPVNTIDKNKPANANNIGNKVDDGSDSEVTIVEPANATPTRVTPKRPRPHLPKHTSEGHEGVPTYTCVALGSKDTGASIWQAGTSRPFFSLSNMFSQDVVDLAWGSSGLTLAAASTDGCVMYLRFTEDELGKVLAMEDERFVLEKARRTYGKSGGNARLIESKVQLEMETRNMKKNEIRREGASETASADQRQRHVFTQQGFPDSQKSLPQLHHQDFHATEGVAVDEQGLQGQADSNSQKPPRRIQPQVVAPVPQGPAAPISAAKPPQAPQAPPLQSNHQTNASLPPVRPQQVVPAPIITLATQKETRGRGGKRRIIPQALDSSVAQETSLSQAAAQPPTKMRRIGNMEEQMGRASGFNKTGANALMNGYASPTGMQGGQGMMNNVLVRDIERTGMPNGVVSVASVVGLNSALLDETNVGKRARMIGDETPPVVLEILRGDSSVVCTKGGKVLWREYYENPSQVAGVAGKFVAIATRDAMLGLHSASTGRRLCPLIAMDSSPHLLMAQIVHGENEEELWYLLVVSRAALCSVYDVKTRKLTCARSAAMLIAKPVELPSGSESKAPTTGSKSPVSRKTTNKTSLTEEMQTLTTRVYREISSGQVTPTGEPILLLNDGQSYCYSRSLHSWLLVAPRAPVNSEFRRSLPMGAGAGKVSTLRALQVRANALGSANLARGDLRRAASDSLAHLETLLGAAEALGSSNDYKYYLALYAARLAVAVEEEIEGIEGRVREVCEIFMEDGNIVGMKKRTLFKKVVLPILAKNRVLQRLVTEFVEYLAEEEKKEMPIENG